MGLWGFLYLQICLPKSCLKFYSSSTAGLDGLHSHLLNACSEALSWPLFLLFFKSFEEGMLPTL